MNVYFYGVKDSYIKKIQSLFMIYFENRIGEISFTKVASVEEVTVQSKKNQIFFCVPEYVNGNSSGIDFAKTVRKRIETADIIFLSMNNLSVISILKKYICPAGFFLFDEIQEAVNHLVSILKDREEQQKTDTDSIEIISQYDKLLIPIDNIVYFVTYNKKIMCKLVDGTDVKFYGTLTQIEQAYKVYFIRCHAGYLVNRKKILMIHMSKSYMDVVNEEIVPISRKYRLDLKNFIESEQAF